MFFTIYIQLRELCTHFLSQKLGGYYLTSNTVILNIIGRDLFMKIRMCFTLDEPVADKLKDMFPSENRERSDFVNYLLTRKINK